MDPSHDCTGADCPTYGGFFLYAPSAAGNGAVAGLFGVLAAAVLVLGVLYRTPLYSALLLVGLLMEAMGYVGRALMARDRADRTRYVVSLLGTVLGATFVSAAVFLVMPHYMAVHGGARAGTTVRPRYVAYLFAALGFLAFVVQAVGCAFAATGFNATEISQGANLLVGGLVVQGLAILSFVVCLLWLRLRVSWRKGQLDTTYAHVYTARGFRYMTYALLASSLLLLVRTIYRAFDAFRTGHNDMHATTSPAFSASLSPPTTEVDFLVLDGGLTLLACLLLVLFSPGAAFGPVWGLTASHSAARRRSLTRGGVGTEPQNRHHGGGLHLNHDEHHHEGNWRRGSGVNPTPSPHYHQHYYYRSEGQALEQQGHYDRGGGGVMMGLHPIRHQHSLNNHHHQQQQQQQSPPPPHYHSTGSTTSPTSPDTTGSSATIGLASSSPPAVAAPHPAGPAAASDGTLVGNPAWSPPLGHGGRRHDARKDSVASGASDKAALQARSPTSVASTTGSGSRGGAAAAVASAQPPARPPTPVRAASRAESRHREQRVWQQQQQQQQYQQGAAAAAAPQTKRGDWGDNEDIWG